MNADRRNTSAAVDFILKVDSTKVPKVTMLPFLFQLIIIDNVQSQTAEVTVDWNSVIATSKTTTTLQVVVNSLLTRESPIHDQSFKSLGYLNADFVRFVPWYRMCTCCFIKIFTYSDTYYFMQRMQDLVWHNYFHHRNQIYVVI